MADHVSLNPGSGGDTVWADEISGVAKVQGIKVLAGGDGTAQMGATVFRHVSDATAADLEAVKASAGVVYGVVAVNVAATDAYLHLYNVASGSVTVGTTTPHITIPLLGDGGVSFPFPVGAIFDTAVSMALTTTVGGSTAVGANEVVVTIFYA